MNDARPVLPSVAEMEAAAALAAKALGELDRLLLGRAELHRLVLAGILSRGHILLEGLPGLGKTALVKAVASILQLDFKRVQFTPDLMPADIVGAHILQETAPGRREMIFQPGPVFTNILLADEINRASPKTQSALLETMQERSVTLLGQTRALPEPFFVLASQNPIEMEGTYPLPEAQVDRFLFRLIVRDVPEGVLHDIIAQRRRGEPPAPEATLSRGDLDRLFEVMARIHLPDAVARYIARLVAATHPTHREATEKVRAYVQYGASPRAAIAIAEAARAVALIEGRPAAGFADARRVAVPALNHRLILNYQARFDGVGPDAIIESLLSGLDEAGLNLPDDLALEPATK